MNIAGLSDLIKKSVSGPHIPLFPPNMPQKPKPTIQPGVPLPTYTPQADGGYTVQGLAPGASTFAQRYGLGVLRNPPSGVVYFDPTGRANDSNAGQWNRGAFLAVPMAMPEYKHFDYMQPIGGGY